MQLPFITYRFIKTKPKNHMESNDLKVGDVVCLNSESPRMTIYSISGETISTIFWNNSLSRFEYIDLSASIVYKS